MFLLVFLLTASLPASATRVRRQATAGHYKGRRRRSKKSHKVQGQKAIDPQRAAEIQEALIREHYLRGNATGNWDASSQAAMQKFQLDNGWQTKIIPDARALIKLGLGPKQDAGEYAASTSLTHSLSSPVAPAATLPQ
ncbi:MAG TPA: peptidoglycan-binding domain-containing protein [Acidobacteriaceae bacterium]|nr:peptidoglycan-binding domain-containing protein [Acidobacteriaceae bacterium]